MDQLPDEILEIILEYVLWDNPEELYPLLRNVSHTWKSAAKRSRLRVFRYWYNRCKTEIPEDHLQDIVQAKYPLVAQPWQKSYWVDSNLAHVAKNAYNIWKNFPDLNDGLDRAKYNYTYPLEGYSVDCTVGMNDKYFAVSDYNDDNRGTRIYRWDNLSEYIRQYDVNSCQIDFYTTKKGTFIILSHFRENKGRSISISRYPIDSLDSSSELIVVRRRGSYCITQNECFYFNLREGSVDSVIIKHKILTKRGFKTSTIFVEPSPVRVFFKSLLQVKIEICGSTLYVVIQDEFGKLFTFKYKISRNSDGKLSFTFEEKKVVIRDRDGRNYSQLYRKLDCYGAVFTSNNLYLRDSAFKADRFHPLLYRVSDRKIVAFTAHANFVFCSDKLHTRSTGIRIFHKDSLIHCLFEANDPAPSECSGIIDNTSNAHSIRFEIY